MFRSFNILEQIKPVDRSGNVGAIHRHVGVGKFNPLESGFPSSEAFPIGFLSNPHGVTGPTPVMTTRRLLLPTPRSSPLTCCYSDRFCPYLSTLRLPRLKAGTSSGSRKHPTKNKCFDAFHPLVSESRSRGQRRLIGTRLGT